MVVITQKFQKMDSASIGKVLLNYSEFTTILNNFIVSEVDINSYTSVTKFKLHQLIYFYLQRVTLFGEGVRDLRESVTEEVQIIVSCERRLHMCTVCKEQVLRGDQQNNCKCGSLQSGLLHSSEILSAVASYSSHSSTSLSPLVVCPFSPQFPT